MKKMVYIYRSYERFWHWTQSFLIIFLAVTGFEIHGSFEFFGYENAVNYHNLAAYAFGILIIFTKFWHFTTGEWKQYLPTTKNLKAQIEYYLLGIFRNAPHPTKKTVLRRRYDTFNNEINESAYRKIETAFNNQKTVEIGYFDMDSAETRKREIDVYHKTRKYVIGYCHLRKAIRKFRTSRIVTARLTDKNYKIPGNFDKNRY